MSLKHTFSLLLGLLLTVGSLQVLPASAVVVFDKSYVEGTDAAAFLFNPLRVNNFEITMTQADLDALGSDQRNYHPARIRLTTEKGVTSYYNVGVRLKGGWGSSRDLAEKAAFKIKVNFSVKGQTLFGIKKFTLNNMVQDTSMLHEATAYRLFRAVGVPAPRIGYANVTLNGVSYGLHLNVETYDNTMFKRWTTLKTQHLYEGAYGTEVGPSMQVDDGSDTDLSDVTDLQTINNTLTGEAWYNAVRTKVDIKEMVADWAVEHYIGHWDGYERGWPNNYFLHITEGGLFTMHPWGLDQTWNDYAFVDNGAQMTGLCISYQPCQDLYLAALTKVEQAATKLALPAMVDKIWTAISPSIALDRFASVNDAQNAKSATRDFMVARLPQLVSFNAGKKLATLNVSYKVTSPRFSSSFLPKVTKTTNGALSFVRIQGQSGVCDLNPNTGNVTLYKKGVCEIAAQTSATSTYQAEMQTVIIKVPAMPSRIQVTNLASIAKGTSLSLAITKDSTAAVKLVKVSGLCKVTGLSVKALAKSGICKVRINVAADANYAKATQLLQIRMR